MKRLITWLSLVGVILLIITASVYAYAFEQIKEYNQQPTVQVQPTKVIPLPDATEVENRINAFRSEKGLSILNSNVASLDQAAQVRAEAMCAANDWSHAQDWATLAPYYSYQNAGENLYYGYLQEEQARVAVRDWIASPSHLTNIVGNYSEMGVAVKSCPGFQNEPTAIIITNYFGVPR